MRAIVAALCLLAVAQVGYAHLESISGDGVIITPPAQLIDDNGAETPMNTLHAFEERQDVTTDSAVNCWLPTSNGLVAGQLPAGTRVNSHMMFHNNAGSSLSTATATATFTNEILCVMGDSQGNMEADSTPIFGIDGTTYDAPFAARGLENVRTDATTKKITFKSGDDWVALPAANQLTWFTRVTEPGDWIRVLTAADELLVTPPCGGEGMALSEPTVAWQDVTPQFRFGVLHDNSGSASLMQGSVFAYVSLSADEHSWDAASGALDATLNVYKEESHTTLLGTLHLTSSEFYGLASGNAGGTVNIAISSDDIFMNDPTNPIKGSSSVNVHFQPTTLDCCGGVVNKFAFDGESGAVNLWGSNGWNGQSFEGGASRGFGMDLRFDLACPETFLQVCDIKTLTPCLPGDYPTGDNTAHHHGSGGTAGLSFDDSGDSLLCESELLI